MSYGHGIHLDGAFDRAVFAAAARDIRTLIRRSEIDVVGASGRPNSLPIAEQNRIAFNGVNHNCVCGSSEPEIRPLCPRDCRAYYRWGSEKGQPFIIDVSSDEYLRHSRRHQYWFDCKTWNLPYDEVVKMSMIVLKHHLGDSITLNGKGNWLHHWGAGHEWHVQPPKRTPGGAVGVYEHVFPERAPVQNVLSSEGIGF